MTESTPPLPHSAIEPLTRKNVTGEPYTRERIVEEQIISCITLSDNDIIARASITNKETVGYLQEEALVYLIRYSVQQQRQELYNALSETLLTRCQEQVDFRLHSLDPDLAEDAYGEIMRILYTEILGMEGQADFLQVRFWTALDRIAIDIFRRYSRRRAKDQANLQPGSFSSREKTEESEEDWEDQLADMDHFIPGEIRWSSVELETLVEEALQALGEPLRTVFVLYHFEDWPIESKDPDELTLSKLYSVTPRTINNWLRKAESKLKTWRGDQHE